MTPGKFIAVAGIMLLAACGKGHLTPETLTNAPEGLGVQGYDPVAYHREARPVRGDARFQSIFKGTVYRFSNTENRLAFDAMPEQYLPAYGGYCAYAMSNGDIVDINPRNWATVDGKLYLNANFLAQALWSLDKPGRINRADIHWSRLKTDAVKPKTAGN